MGLSRVLEKSKPVATELIELGKTAAAAAEMLAATGKLPKDEKLDYALEYVASLLPENHQYTPEQIRGAIEAGVFLVNTLGKAAK